MSTRTASDHPLKLILVGDTGVGKTCLLMSFISEQWDADTRSTIGVDFKIKNVDCRGKKVKLTIWDTAGQERFRELTTAYYRGIQGVIIVYDITRKDTFENITEWIKDIDMFCTEDNVIKMLVGNKIDLEKSRRVSTTEGLMFAEENNMLFFEASAKTKLSVRDSFIELVEKILDTPQAIQDRKNLYELSSELIDLKENDNNNTKNKVLCCSACCIPNNSQKQQNNIELKQNLLCTDHRSYKSVEVEEENKSKIIIEEKKGDGFELIEVKKEEDVEDINNDEFEEKNNMNVDMDFSHNFAFCDYEIDRSFDFKIFAQLFMFALLMPFTMLMQQFCHYNIGSVLKMDYIDIDNFLYLNDFLLWFSKMLCLDICCKNRKMINQFVKAGNIEIRNQKTCYSFLRTINWIFITILWLWLFQIIWIVGTKQYNEIDIMLYTQNVFMLIVFIGGCIIFGLQYGYQANLCTEYRFNDKYLTKYEFCVGIYGDINTNLLKLKLELEKKQMIESKSTSTTYRLKRRIFVLLYGFLLMITTLYSINFDIDNIKWDYYLINIIILCLCNILFVVMIYDIISRIIWYNLSLYQNVMNNITMMLSPFWCKKYQLNVLYLQNANNFQSWLELRGYYIYKMSEWTLNTECLILILSLIWMLLAGIAFFKLFFNQKTIWINNLPWNTIIIWLILNAYFIFTFIKIAIKFEKLQKKQIEFIIMQQTFYINNSGDIDIQIKQKFNNIKEFISQKTVIPKPFSIPLTQFTSKIILATIISALPTVITYIVE